MGCSSSKNTGVGCDRISGTCPKGLPPLPSQVNLCNQILADTKCGLAFQSYLSCEAAQQKCTADGREDTAATSAAIESACLDAATAYENCANEADGGCSPFSEVCCPTSPAPCRGCCDDATLRCVFEGSACSDNNTLCRNGSCIPCGRPGQPCCPMPWQCMDGCCSEDPRVGPAGATCSAVGEACASLSSPTVCTGDGTCSLCGVKGSIGVPAQPCCANNVCSFGSCSAGTCQ